jgi:predicted molibdopterin-dependent oxidoreductase YjgC
MKDDRELLEAAAKAFWGDEIDDVVSVEWGEQDESILYTHGENQDHNGRDRTYRWNPLEENHDAFELAVKLRIVLRQFHSNAMAGAVRENCNADDQADRMRATRRAIVRAAAALGSGHEGAGS